MSKLLHDERSERRPFSFTGTRLSNWFARRLQLVWILIGCLALTACGKKQPAPVGQDSATKPAGVSVDNLLKDSAANPATPPPADAPSPSPEQSAAAAAPAMPAKPPPSVVNEITTGADADFSAGSELKGGELATPQVLASYNKRLARVNYQISDFPENLEQLKKWPMMPPLPKAPPGKRLVYDLRARMIRLDPP